MAIALSELNNVYNFIPKANFIASFLDDNIWTDNNSIWTSEEDNSYFQEAPLDIEDITTE